MSSSRIDDSTQTRHSQKGHSPLRSAVGTLQRGALWCLRRCDWLVVGVIVAILLASLAPARGQVAHGLHHGAFAMLCVLFFLYGVKLSPRETLLGLRNKRLHLTIAAFTFLVFPLCGLAARYALAPFIGTTLALGILYLTLVPSTVQSSIAFTHMAGGNMAGAIVSASMSNMAGVVLTPLLVALTMGTGGDITISGSSFFRICSHILLPFLLGQICHRWLAGWVVRRAVLTRLVDRGTIWLIVYTSFSDAVIGGVWHHVTPVFLAGLAVGCLLGVCGMLAASWAVTGLMGMPREDRIAVQFCGSKKSLTTGVAMGTVLFAHMGGVFCGQVMLPLMVFHLLQLIVCAILAGRYARPSRPLSY